MKEFLDNEYDIRNNKTELNLNKLDPIIVAKKYKNEFISLICALFAYGNVKQIVKFLNSLDFSLLEENERKIRLELNNFYYRFQSNEDVIQFFITLKRVKSLISIEDIFYQGYKKNRQIINGLQELLEFLYDVNSYRSKGYEFLLGKIPKDKIKSPYKRWNMYFRWMVRNDNIDLGLWKNIDKKDLLIPLDTHTFNVSKKIGLLKRKTYDFKAVVELTNKLKEFDSHDPVKYDFAIYRLGQEKIV